MSEIFIELCEILTKVLVFSVKLSLKVNHYTSMKETSPSEVIELLPLFEKKEDLFQLVLEYFVPDSDILRISSIRKYAIFMLILNIVRNNNDSLFCEEDIKEVFLEFENFEKNSQDYIVPPFPPESSEIEFVSYNDDPHYRVIVSDQTIEIIQKMRESDRTLLLTTEAQSLDCPTSRSKMINFMIDLKQDIDNIDFSCLSDEESD